MRGKGLFVVLLPLVTALSAQQSAGYSKDINLETYNRFPPVQRADLDDYGKKVFDENVAPGSARTTLAGGPVAIRMLVPQIAEHLHFVNQYLRADAGISPRFVELTILVTTRELDAQFEWSGHERAALKAGVPQAEVDVIKYRKRLANLPEQDAALIELGREAVGQKKVSAETFARAEKFFGQKGVVSIAALMGEYSAAAILLRVADQQMPPGPHLLLPIP